MKRLGTLIALIFILSVFLASESFAQRGMGWKGSGGWRQGSRYGRIYDSKTVETFSGEVISVEQVTPFRGMCNGVHLIVKRDKETVSVHLGPFWYIENQGIHIKPGDQVEITGSRVTIEGNPAVIAANVKIGDDTLKLRDENGIPAWSGWRRGRRL